MKRTILFLPLMICLYSMTGYAQLSNGGIYAGFGVDADTRTNWVKYGSLKGNILSDDWFAPSGSGYNVIDTANSASYLSQLKAGANIAFNQRMSSLLYARNGGKLWIDAVYGRDYIAASTSKDSTTFSISAKNGDNPSNWQGGAANTPTKNDLVDVFAHMRRDGVSVHDSLWFFTGVTTYGTSGSSYFDVELYRKNLSYNKTSGAFSTSGTEAGHTQWLFDASGNITQTGDMIFAVSFSPGSVPVVDLRIWVAKTTMNTVVPSYFDFTGNYDGGTTYGYASIVSKAGTTAWGGGISNYSAAAAQDTTYAAPWGTANATGTNSWSSNFVSQQYIEIGMNLTRIGVDPALYQTLSACQDLFSNVFFKSRSSTSFSSNLQDFMAPLTFTRPPVMDYSLRGDTLRCNRSVASITLTNNSTVGIFTWKTLSGEVIGSNSDSSVLQVDKPGKYLVSASPAAGCPATRVDTVVIPIDTFPPVASASSGYFNNKINLYGGNVSASNYTTPFGGSSGLAFQWAGPNAFSSTLQNPVTDTVWGTYKIVVTEKRNGCTATASTAVAKALFTTLVVDDILLSGAYHDGAVALDWQDAHSESVIAYAIERASGSDGFVSLGQVAGLSAPHFVDARPMAADNYYRVSALSATGQVVYSRMILVHGSEGPVVRLAGNAASGLALIVDAAKAGRGDWSLTNAAGQVLYRSTAYFVAGSESRIALPVFSRRQVCVVRLVMDGKVFVTEALF